MKSHRVPLLAIGAAALMPLRVAIGQMSVSPFMSLMPSVNGNPLAGMGLTFGGTTGLAFRGSGDLSIANTNTAAANAGYRPWGADADAMLFLSGLGGGRTTWSHSTSPYVFAGLGLTGGDSAGANVVHNGWSYGAGATIPLGLDADVFGEARFRMSQYMLPTARESMGSRSEFRFGLSFHIGGSSPERHGRRYDDDAPRAVPAAAPVTVVYPPAPPAPVIIQQSAPAPVYQPAPVYDPGPVATSPVIVEPAPVVEPVVVEQRPPIVIAPTIAFPIVRRPVIERPIVVERPRRDGGYRDGGYRDGGYRDGGYRNGGYSQPVVEQPIAARPINRQPELPRRGPSQQQVVTRTQAPERYVVPAQRSSGGSGGAVVRQERTSEKAKDSRRPD